MLLTQIQFETREKYQERLNDFLEQKISYEAYINFILGQMYDEGHQVKEVIYLSERDEFLIIYLMKN